jgi:outer membrane protein OmpA-like peptidoglycan-associated protein
MSVVSALLAVGILAGCSSAPKLEMPDGSSRTPVNSAEDMERYATRERAGEARPSKRVDDKRQLEAIQRQIAALRQYVALMAVNVENAPKPVPLVTAPKPRQVGDGESMEVRDQSIVFRISPTSDSVQFAPSRDVQALLLKAARESERIEVRGRTDADTDSKASSRDARNAAQSARDFLVKNGIAPSKVHMSSMGAGGFLVENSSPAGKAVNRRVEIETMDMNTYAFRPWRNAGASVAQSDPAASNPRADFR